MYKPDYWIVTSATPEYVPGLITLKNSLDINFPEAKLACFYYDKGFSVPLPENIEYIHNAPMLGKILDEGRKFRDGLELGPDMFARLLIPNYFDGKVFYVDADCVVLKNIKEAWDIDLQGNPTGCVYRPDIGWIGGHRHDDMASGTYLCDTNKWRELRLTEKCFEAMQDRLDGKIVRTFHVNVESILSYIHNEKFLHLPVEYQNLTYYGSLIKTDKIAHFAGPKPWHIDRVVAEINNKKLFRKVAQPCNYKGLWEAYHNRDLTNIQHYTNQLPTIRPNNPWDRKRRA